MKALPGIAWLERRFLERKKGAGKKGAGKKGAGMNVPISDIAFTPAVKAAQERMGSRSGYAKMEERGGWSDVVTPDLVSFLAERDSFYLATASADGRPYIQHRGGPPGFLKVLDGKTLAFADYKGNRQYISVGNLSENDRALTGNSA